MMRLVHNKIGKLRPIVIDEAGKKELRDGSQTDAFKNLRDKQLTILNAPTGWGKSLVTLFIVTWKLLKDPKLRCVIVVPQTVISKGFLEDVQLRVRGKKINWNVGHNLCHTRADKRVAALGRFLRRRRQTVLSDRVLVCTHATLAAAYRELPGNVFKNLVLWIDEAHHVMNGEVVDGSLRSNTMGKIVLQCIENGCHVGLATATFMRGDLRHILSTNEAEEFVAERVPYDTYFNESPPVESFSIDLLCGKKEKSLRSILKTREKTIIYLPKRQSHFATCKIKERNAIFRILARGGKIRKGPVVTMCGTTRVVDLIETKGRKARQQYLMKHDDIDVIVALDTCKEGFDWPAASRCIMIGERKSIPEMVQMVGRLFRRYEGKTHASIYQIMPSVKQGERFKKHRNRIWSSIFASMLLEDVLIPLQFCKPLAATMSNSAACQSLWRDFTIAIKGLEYDESFDRMASVFEGRVPESEWKVRWKDMWERLWRLVYSMRGETMDVDFEVLKSMNVIDELLLISSDMCGAKTFEEFREAIGRGRKSDAEHEALLFELIKGGKTIPPQRELKVKYRHGFSQWWYKNKHRFPNVKQETHLITSAEHEAMLRKLTRGGKALPPYKELTNEYGYGFSCWWCKNKHRFPKVRQESRYISYEKHEETLRKLTSGDKALPSYQELKVKCGQGFIHWWQYNKHRFPNVKQASFRKSSAEFEAMLRKLTKGGRPLPPWKELSEKYGEGFYNWYRNNKHRFPNVKRESHFTTQVEHEMLLRKLTRGGKALPGCNKRKEKYGYGFDKWWYANRHRFPKVKVAGARKTSAQFEDTFQKLTRGGKAFPGSKERREKYGHGFDNWWYANRHRFPKVKVISNFTTPPEYEAMLRKLTKGGKALPGSKGLREKYGSGFHKWWYANRHRFPKVSQKSLRTPTSEHEALLRKLTKNGKPLSCYKELKKKYPGFCDWYCRNKHRFPKVKQEKLR